MSTSIRAELILASKHSDTGTILYTFRWTYPRYILAEVNTHRTFSRNTASSRAIPTKRMRRQVLDDPHIPIHHGAAQKGMQAHAEVGPMARRAGTAVILGMRSCCALGHWCLEKLGYHKQVANRYIEPWIWTTQLVSFTDVNNFLWQRNHEMAEPHIQLLAEQSEVIIELIKNDGAYIGRYQNLNQGGWHLPLLFSGELEYFGVEDAKLISAGRCAHTSYYDIGTGGTLTPERAIEVAKGLIDSSPRHYSPLEHQAQALYINGPIEGVQRRHGNFKDFVQFRKQFEGESGEAI